VITQVKAADPKHIRLVQSMFMYIAACLRDGDAHAIRELRIRPDQTHRLLRMTTTDLLILAESGIDCVSININADALDDVFDRLERGRLREELIDQCIKCDAPRAMMQVFFGLSRHRYSRRRAALAMPVSTGRTAQPTEALEAEIYKRWRDAGGRWTAVQLLEVARSVEVSLRVVWDVLGRLRPLDT
jgi:hypothetical protein